MARGDGPAQAANSQYEATQQKALTTQNGLLGQYIADNNKLKAGGTIAQNPYAAPQYLENQNVVTAASNHASNDQAKEALATQTRRTGVNGAGYKATIADIARTNARNRTAYQAGQSTDNYNRYLGLEQQLMQNEAGAAGQYGQQYGTATQGRDSALGDITQLQLSQNQMWGTMLGAGLQAGGAIGAAYCPAEGSLYLLPNGSEKAVELLKVGEQILGIDGEPQTIEEIQTAIVDIIRSTTDNGFSARNSMTHAFALPLGGFTVAARSLGKKIATKNGPGEVISVEPAGRALVFNVITDGSHTYRADGIWALGVGDAERQISMETWDRIGSQMRSELRTERRH